MPDDSLQLLKGTLDLLVLRTLRASGEELHGFAVLEWIRRTSDEAFIVEEGALYPALHRMEKRKLVRSEWGISEKGRRARYYRLTAKGVRALERQNADWSRYVEAMAKLAAADSGGKR